MKRIHLGRLWSGQRLGIAALMLALGFAQQSALAVTPLADQPVFAVSEVPGNVALALSVEYPTAIRAAYTSAYSSASTYLGYFDPAKCYSYVLTADATTSYFDPAGLAATNHNCSANSSGRWSGNFLNWATTQTIDPFRWAMTGGYRVVDDIDNTVLQKAYSSDQDNSLFPDRSLNNSTDVSGATPFSTSNFTASIASRGFKMAIRAGSNIGSGTPTTYDPSKAFDNSKVYELTMRVRVCVPGSASGGVEANCKQYGTNWKPEGLIQQYSQKMRFSAFGYLNDSNILRDGGILRARQKFVGPMTPVPGQTARTNDLSEWNSLTGQFIINPDSGDAKSTSDAFGVLIGDSGVMNYLNKFGQLTTGSYKTHDPVSELYYAALRYYRNLGNVSTWSDMSGANTTTKTTWVDGFPVIAAWDDPIQYSCQRNFVLGIGDVYTHADRNVPGNSVTANEPSMPSEVTGDTSVNAVTATNKVGVLQGMGTTLGTDAPLSGCCSNNGNLMAGLAYDANTKDIRPDNTTNAATIGKQTVQTYWVDVLEKPFVANNQYYLAAKYGGLNVPSDFEPYASTTTASTIQKSWWSTTGEKVGTGTSAPDRPDNYFTAGQPDKMIAGLTQAFASIASAIKAYTTSFSLSTAQVSSSGAASYASQYDSNGWTGVVTASQITFAADGTPTSTPKWSTSSTLQTQLAVSGSVKGWDTGRNVATWNGSAGIAFRTTTGNLTAAQQTALTPSYATSVTAADYVNYLRGDTSNEIGSTTSGTKKALRRRTLLLGDIVDAKLTPVGPPAQSYSESSNPGYTAFKTKWTTTTPRPTMVYAGANDGMLHAFNGALTGTGAGTEQFAYVPSALYQGPNDTPQVDGLVQLGSPNYVHHFYVDATPVAYDIDFNSAGGTFTTTSTGGSDWHTLLVGGLGKGGKSYYAIDVTDPASMSTETAVAGKVKWEITSGTTTGYDTMGYSYGTPIVVKTKKYGWVVVLTSGYNNSDNTGYLYFVNPRNGALLEKVATPTSSHGLAQAAAYVTDYTDNTADAIYVGDLDGQLWRFDVTQAKGSTGYYPAPTLLATLTDASSNAQPITSAPLIEIHPLTRKRFVLVGTGRLLDTSDVNSPAAQSFYAIIDGTAGGFTSGGTTITRADLTPLTDVLAGVNLPNTSKGWYMDLGVITSGDTSIGWRLVSSPTAYNGVIAFAALMTSADACSPSGQSRVYALNYGTGKSVLSPVGTGYIGFDSAVTDLRIISVDGKPEIIAGTTKGEIKNPPADLKNSVVLRLLNWRELPTVD